MLELGDRSAIECKLTWHELKLAGGSVAVQVGDFAKIDRIDTRKDERRKWKAYHSSTRKARIEASKASDGSLSNLFAYLVALDSFKYCAVSICALFWSILIVNTNLLCST